MDSMSSNTTSSNRMDATVPWTLRNGSAVSGASVLAPLSLYPLSSNAPPRFSADLTKHLIINQTGITTWVLNHSPYSEPKTPILYGNSSDGWNAETTLHFPSNKTVDLITTIANDSMDIVSPHSILFHLISVCHLFALYQSLFHAIRCLVSTTSSTSTLTKPFLAHLPIPSCFYLAVYFVASFPPLTTRPSDEPPHPPSWSQILGPRLRHRLLPIRHRRRRPFLSHQHKESTVSRYHRNPSVWMVGS